MIETTINALTPETIEQFIGACMATFAIGWGIATLFKTFKQFGEKI